MNLWHFGGGCTFENHVLQKLRAHTKWRGGGTFLIAGCARKYLIMTLEIFLGGVYIRVWERGDGDG